MRLNLLFFWNERKVWRVIDIISTNRMINIATNSYKHIGGRLFASTPRSTSLRLRIPHGVVSVLICIGGGFNYYLFVCGCRIRCGALIFSNSEVMRKAWSSGRSVLRQRQSSESLFVSRHLVSLTAWLSCARTWDLSTRKHWFSLDSNEIMFCRGFAPCIIF